MPELSSHQFPPAGQERLFDDLPFHENPEERSDREDQERVQTEAQTHAATVRAPLSALPGILGENEFLSQHYTGTSRGMFDPDYRAGWEEEAGFERPPIYGTLEQAGGQPGSRVGHQYGAARFEMKRDVRPRTRVIQGDSLDSWEYPKPLMDVASGETPMPESGYGGGFNEIQIEPKSRNLGEPLSSARSLEIDVGNLHGPRSRRYADVGQAVELGQQFEERGVPTRIKETSEVYQPPLPMSEQELASQDFVTNRFDRPVRFDESGRRHENVERVERSFPVSRYGKK